MPLYRTAEQIDFKQGVVIQQRLAGANLFGDFIPDDALLVFENGMWKYPEFNAASAAGAVVVNSACRLSAIQATFGGSVTWSLTIAGNAANTSGEPYPSGSAALYTEGSVVVTSGTGTGGATAPAALLLPGQRIYLTTSGGPPANSLVRFFFSPLLVTGVI